MSITTALRTSRAYAGIVMRLSTGGRLVDAIGTGYRWTRNITGTGGKMDLNEITGLKRTLSLQIKQKIREFERATDCQLASMKITRDEMGIKEVKIAILLE